MSDEGKYVVRESDRSGYRVRMATCSCPEINVTGVDTPPGEHHYVIGWDEFCEIHGYKGTNPTYRKVLLTERED